ncbi:MAG: twitch domain-containing radical SAM protein [Reichenbachiella sp.]|uniref:twitch domain-containing radical SAM protein n=1 Tax=Reichenbachiella sp. TaxID=2184521 RepID=UPI00329A1A5D
MPWLHLHVDTDGLVKACCNANIVLGDINSQSIQEIWQDEPIRKFRKFLIEGGKDKRCRSCFSKEEAGKSSMRTETNQKFEHRMHWVHETDIDGKSVKAKPVYFDIRFNNLCNLRCRTCWHGASSSWFEEAKLLKQNFGNKPIIEASKDSSRFVKELLDQGVEVEEIYFAGGEPLMMKEHYDWLEGLIQQGQTKVHLRYNSNLSVLKLKGRSALDLWMHFERVTVSASIDHVGAEGEYIRKGVSWKGFVDNMKTIKTKAPHVKLEIAPTVSVFNVSSLPDLHRYFVEEKLIDIDSVYLNLLSRPDYYNIKVLPEMVKVQVGQSMEKHVQWLVAQGAKKSLINEYKALIQFMNKDDWSSKLPKLKKQLEVLDGLRGESFHQIFPELSQVLDPS